MAVPAWGRSPGVTRAILLGAAILLALPALPLSPGHRAASPIGRAPVAPSPSAPVERAVATGSGNGSVPPPHFLSARCALCGVASLRANGTGDLLFDPLNGRIYADDGANFGGKLDEINATTNTVVGSLSFAGELALDSWYGYLVVVANNGPFQAPTIETVDTMTGQVINSTWPTIAPGPQSITFDDRNGRVYVIDNEGYAANGTFHGANEIQSLYVDASGNVTLNSTTSSSAAYSDIEFDPLAGRLYVNGGGGLYGKILVLDPQTFAVLATFPNASLIGWALDPSTDEVFLSAQEYSGDYLVVLNGTTDRVLRTVLEFGLSECAFDPANGLLYGGQGDVYNVTTGLDYAGSPPPYGGGFSSGPFGIGSETAQVTKALFDPLDDAVYFVSNEYGSNRSTLFVVAAGPSEIPPSGTGPVVSPDPADVGLPVQASVNVTGPRGGAIASYVWSGLPCPSQNLSTVRCPLTPGSIPPAPWQASVTVAFPDGWNLSGSSPYEIAPALTAALTANARTVDVNQSVTFQDRSTGGIPPYTYVWSVQGAGAGCSTGNVSTITCSPKSVGGFRVGVNVTDALGVVVTSNSTSVTVDPALVAQLSISNATPWLGQSIALVLNASGGNGTYTYEYTGLPPGCVSVDLAYLGCLPTEAGGYNVTGEVIDQNLNTVDSVVQLEVVFDFTVVAPASTVVGQAMTIRVVTPAFGASTAGPRAGGGVVGAAPVGFDYTYTGLPPGCTGADAATITCTPTKIGTYPVVVTVRDPAGDRNQHTVVLRVTTGGGLFANGSYVVVGVGGGVAVAGVLGALGLRRARRRREERRSPPARRTP